MSKAEPIFNAILHPHRSLSRVGFLWLMVAIGFLLFFVSVPFYFIGAWPIVGFAGLDLFLIYWAFRRNFHEARAREQLLVSDAQVKLIRTCPKGNIQHFAFNPYWVRLESEREEDRGMTKLTLTSHGRKVEVGAFLFPRERENLAKALGKALSDVKSPPARPLAQLSGG